MQKDHEEAKETQGESKRRATGTTRARAEAPTALPPAAAMSHEGSPELPRRVARASTSGRRQSNIFARAPFGAGPLVAECIEP